MTISLDTQGKIDFSTYNSKKTSNAIMIRIYFHIKDFKLNFKLYILFFEGYKSAFDYLQWVN